MLAYFHKDIDLYKNKIKKSFHKRKEVLTDKKDSNRILMKKKRFSRIKRIQKDFHKKNRVSQMITSKNKCVQINS